MKKQTFLLFVVLIAFTAAFVSCKKQDKSNSNNTPPVQCYITDVKMPSNSNYEAHIEYNSDNKISSVTSNFFDEQRNFLYDGNKIYIRDTDTMEIVEIDTITLNSAGFVSTIVRHYDGLTDNETMSYDAANELIELDTKGVYTSKNVYVWKDGNPIARINNSLVDSFKYDMSKKAKAGDYLSGAYLAYGAPTFKATNLVVEFAKTPITYDYDADGKITSITIQQAFSRPQISNYTYTCK